MCPCVGLLGISAGPVNTLHRRHPLSGIGLWTLQLESPPVAVHLADGSNLNLYAQDSGSNESMVIVGILKDSMYALPVSADWLQRSLPRPVTDSQTYAIQHSLAPHQEADTDVAERNLQGMHVSKGHSSNKPDSAQLSTAQHRRRQGEVRISNSHSDMKFSHALVAVPSMEADDDSCEWQNPVSIHSVLPSTLPQNFLPQMTEAAEEVEETNSAQPYGNWWAGKIA